MSKNGAKETKERPSEIQNDTKETDVPVETGGGKREREGK